MPSDNTTKKLARQALEDMFRGLRIKLPAPAQQTVKPTKPTQKSEGAVCNDIVKQWRPHADDTPIAIVTMIGTQICRCCTETHQYIAGQYVEFTNNKLAAKRLVETTISDDTVDHRTGHFDPVFVDHCPKCLSIGKVVDEVLYNLHCEHSTCEQLTLFH